MVLRGVFSYHIANIEQGYNGVMWGLGGGNGSKIPTTYTISDQFRKANRYSPVGVPPIVYFGTQEQKERFLPGVANGTIRFCLGITEPDGSAIPAARTKH